ncbi:hypothetical protein COT65_02385 [Candidatus Shapirobacteria bacterium CG09_land_8_20_14_0_10_47_13]|uniref:Glycosyltransferase RgtA/B/C/D-like domain-containing protein n=1 Tax=Candidatus Shapirobacteria bacterium CG09_land_8_20_14_0_10_47_13 TaxID=1974481 RepID=A0A2H0WMF6_9BACT|nr:MAG: hypothetical protein COT65_02385 [Candidatus Shapirobacteria bacterium CG09_land_8_20_14_0_10_47_13]
MKKIHPLTWLFVLALFLFFLIPPTDPDLGWHLKCGQQIWQALSTGGQEGWCGENHFSVLLENYAWVNHYWLYQVGLWLIFRAAGLGGLTALNAFLMSLAFLFLYSAIKNYTWEKMVAIGLVIFFSWGIFSFGIRSQLMGFLFFNLVLWLFSQIEKNKTAAFSLPLIMLLWAQVHGGSVVLGLILLVFWGLSLIVNRTQKLWSVLVVFGLSLGATVLNPFGLKIYQESWRHFAGVNLSLLIAEWVPPIPAFWWLILISALALSFAVLFWGGIKNWPWAVLTLAMAVLALKARRNLVFYFSLFSFLSLSLPPAQKYLAGWLKQKNLRDNLAILTATAFLFFGLFIRLPETLAINSSWGNYCQNSAVIYPCRAIEFLKKQPGKGPPGGEAGVIFNRYEWGGFLIWQLPEYQIFVDGRMPAWLTPEGKSPYTIYLETLQNQPGWEETLKRYKVDWILISPGTFMDLLLAPGPEKFGWRQVYRDKIAVVYQKR